MIFDAEVRTLNLLLSSSPDPAVPAAGLARRQGGARVYSRRRWPWNVDEMCCKIGVIVVRFMGLFSLMIVNVEVRNTSLKLLLPSMPAFSPDPAGEAAGLARRRGGARVYSITRRRWPLARRCGLLSSASQLVVAAGGGHLLWPIVISSTTCFFQRRTKLI